MAVSFGAPQSIDSKPSAARYQVRLKNAEDLGTAFAGRGVVFHGINKSGSLAMADVMREAYVNAGRESEFISHYHKMPATYDEIVSLIARPSNGHQFFVGHYLFNVANPTNSKLWITQLRHPLPRVVSCYQWLKNKHRKRTGSWDGFPSLTEFVRNCEGKRHSQMIQFAPEGARGQAGKRMSLTALKENAIEQLRSRVHWFGIAEYFEESIFALAHLCGIPSVIAWKKDTRNTDRTLVSDLPVHEVELIKEYFADDIETYEYAKSLFLKRIARIDFGDTFSSYKEKCAGEYKDRLI